MEYADFLSYTVGGNEVLDLIFAVVRFIVVYVVLAVIWKFLLKRLQVYASKTKIQLDDIVVEVLQGVGAPFYIVLSLFIAVQPLSLAPIIITGVKAVLLIVIVAEVIKLVERVIQFSISRSMQRSGKSQADEAKVSSIFSIFIKITLWSIGLLLILSNLGFNVTSLVAGLGIGGLAISLALQNVLSDMFSSLSIAVDKPFQEGDFIVVGTDKGKVKHIGLKTTRIEALQGEEIVISNNELTTARVQNFKKLKKRRIVFNIGVTYGTPTEKLKKIPNIVKQCVKAQNKTDFDRAHFLEFGDFSLNYEIVYYIDSAEYLDYVDAQQAINLAILEEFEKEGIEIAFPTQTVIVEKG